MHLILKNSTEQTNSTGGNGIAMLDSKLIVNLNIHGRMSVQIFKRCKATRHTRDMQGTMGQHSRLLYESA